MTKQAGAHPHAPPTCIRSPAACVQRAGAGAAHSHGRAPCPAQPDIPMPPTHAYTALQLVCRGLVQGQPTHVEGLPALGSLRGGGELPLRVSALAPFVWLLASDLHTCMNKAQRLCE